MQQDYFTIKELSEYTHIGINTLYKAVQNNELAHLVVGTRKVIVSKEDFQRWFDNKKQSPVLHHGHPVPIKRKLKKPTFNLD